MRNDDTKPLKTNRFKIPKSRYDSVDCYIYSDPSNRPEYNDNDMPLDEAIKETLMSNGMDELLSNHFAHLFIRDPIVIFEETLEQDDETSSDHFEVGLLIPWCFLAACPFLRLLNIASNSLDDLD